MVQKKPYAEAAGEEHCVGGRTMRLPFVGNIKTQKKTLGIFGGINQTEVIAENEFADMENMSSDLYPAIGTRSPRGEE